MKQWIPNPILEVVIYVKKLIILAFLKMLQLFKNGCWNQVSMGILKLAQIKHSNFCMDTFILKCHFPNLFHSIIYCQLTVRE